MVELKLIILKTHKLVIKYAWKPQRRQNNVWDTPLPQGPTFDFRNARGSTPSFIASRLATTVFLASAGGGGIIQCGEDITVDITFHVYRSFNTLRMYVLVVRDHDYHHKPEQW